MGDVDKNKETGSKQRVGLLGGSFDPVHIGHIAIANSFLHSNYLDKVWVLLTPDPPHKSYRSLASFKDRYKMLERAFQDYSNIQVSQVENELPRPTYTLKTIHYLKHQYPFITFHLCLGSDSLLNFHKWYKYQEILKEVDLLVAQRPGEDLSKVKPHIMDKTQLVEHEPIDLSSTEIRDRIKKGGKPVNSLPKEVFDYIEENNLYKD